MDKYIEVFCKQSPVMEMKCGNPDCTSKFKVKSKEFFKDKTYSHTCEECSKSTEYDNSEIINNFAKQLKKLGITVK